MDPQLAQTAGTTVVALLATEAWTATRDGVVALWRRASPARADDAAAAIEETVPMSSLPGSRGVLETEEALAGEWYGGCAGFSRPIRPSHRSWSGC
ncbi:hypothetical protein K4749_28655 [Streptomyces sp. TRM72054]|uniref:hypothetical protein n=1 Tax=Streptomyces sp. TRM72054 TaxID=2870562 RepID=UPI001C8C8008|nr:hypothetical protein [Streptomyces sp. TRM72054]MBX9397448.1 hypothetical protein [Streptomyces sp. TRM72054]